MLTTSSVLAFFQQPIRAAGVCFILFVVVFAAGSEVCGETVRYMLDNVILDSGGRQMTGEFSWTYDDPEEFENGEGLFTSLDIPYTLHDHTDLNATFDIGSSIEITLEGSVHDDGVDITLFLLTSLTPTGGAAMDLARSKYEIGGNGFHDGAFLSGSISLVADDTPGDTDGDRDVDDADYANLVAQFGGPPGAESADFNNDGRVDLDDFVIQRTNFGFGVATAPGFAVTIPEPITLGILALGGLTLLGRRRRASVD